MLDHKIRTGTYYSPYSAGKDYPAGFRMVPAVPFSVTMAELKRWLAKNGFYISLTLSHNAVVVRHPNYKRIDDWIIYIAENEKKPTR